MIGLKCPDFISEIPVDYEMVNTCGRILSGSLLYLHENDLTGILPVIFHFQEDKAMKKITAMSLASSPPTIVAL